MNIVKIILILLTAELKMVPKGVQGAKFARYGFNTIFKQAFYQELGHHLYANRNNLIMTVHQFILVASLWLVVLSAVAEQKEMQTQSFHSSIEQTKLIELYTSEGCSSCPPADRWLSSLKNHPTLWTDVIPIAFHVDYWDYIGWEDRFAKNEFSQRQRRYAAEYSESTVYTPGLKINGHPWLNWRREGAAGLNTQAEKVGILSLEIYDNERFSASFTSTHSAERLTLNIAVLGMNLASEVKRGENKGKQLAHDFVVLGHRAYEMTTKDLRWQGSLPETEIVVPKMAVAAWVSRENSLSPLQAVAGYLELQP